MKPILFVDQSSTGILDLDSWEIISSQFSARLLVVGELVESPRIPSRAALRGVRRVICPAIDDVAGRGKILVSADPDQLKVWDWWKIDTREFSPASIVNELQWLAERVNLKFAVTLSLPPQSLHPNKRDHHRKRDSDKKHYREECVFLVRSAMFEQFNESLNLDRAEIQLRYFFRERTKRDPDNLIAWAKSLFDALTIAGVLADDNDVIHLPPRQHKDAGNPRVEIMVTAL